MAAGDISRGCDYLNRLISQPGMGSGPDRRPTVISGKYKKQNVQAVSQVARLLRHESAHQKDLVGHVIMEEQRALYHPRSIPEPAILSGV